jgi:hypothetical protein
MQTLIMTDSKEVVTDPKSMEDKYPVEDGMALETDLKDVSAGQSDVVLLTPKEDRRLTTKIDFKVIPILGLVYLICFLDRTNIANARIAGLEKGLNMPSKGYNTALWIFYIPFVIAEVPSNMIMSLPKIKPNIWLGSQCFILGTIISYTSCLRGLLILLQGSWRRVKALLNLTMVFSHFAF